MEIIPEPPLTAELIGQRHARLRARLEVVADGAGRDPEGFRVVAVTKTWPVEVCRAALDAGLTLLGENRVQEAEPKVAALPKAEWHLVGRLQSNKARRAVRAFAVIHSVDSIELLARIDEVAADEELRPALLLQVNLSGEPGKGGFDADGFAAEAGARGALAEAIGALRAASVAGLMTMGRLAAPPAEARAAFARLRELRDRLAETIGRPLPELSMGMTADAEEAVAEGATLVRIGTALFGPRAG
jgi:pyridoxal phosphate enzyme (YggS family)